MPLREDVMNDMMSEARANAQLQNSQPEQQLVAKAAASQPPQGHSAAYAAFRGLAHGASLGAEDYLNAGVSSARQMIGGQPSTFQKNLAESQADREQARAEHPYAYGAGEMGGIAISPANEIFPGAGLMPMIGRSMLQAGVTKAAETGSPTEAAKAAGTTGIATAVTGPIFNKLGQLVSRTAAGEEATRALGGTVNQVEKRAQTYAANAARPAENATSQAVTSEAQLGNSLLKSGLVRGGDNIYTTAERIFNAKQHVGEQIGQMAEMLDDAGRDNPLVNNLDATKVFEKAKAAVDAVKDKYPSEVQAIDAATQHRLLAFANAYTKRVTDEGVATPLKFGELSAFKTSLARAAYKDEAVKKIPPAMEAVQAIERSFNGSLEDGMGKAANTLGSPKFLGDYLGLKNQYQALTLSHNAAQQGVKAAREAAASTTTRTLARAGAAGWALKSMANGQGLSALIPAAAILALPTASRLVKERGRNVLASAMNQAADVAEPVGQALQSAGTSGQGVAGAGIVEALRNMSGR